MGTIVSVDNFGVNYTEDYTCDKQGTSGCPNLIKESEVEVVVKENCIGKAKCLIDFGVNGADSLYSTVELVGMEIDEKCYDESGKIYVHYTCKKSGTELEWH